MVIGIKTCGGQGNDSYSLGRRPRVIEPVEREPPVPAVQSEH